MSTSDWHPDGLDAFFKSAYTFDDAQKLAELWSIPLVEAKQALGHKIINEIEDLLPKEIRDSKLKKPDVKGTSAHWDPNGLDAFFKSNYTYEDAEALSNLWNIGIVEAKQAIGHKIINDIQNLLPSGLEKPTSKTGISPDANFQAYVKSDYNYDDAVLLASLWSLGVPEAKNEIGFHVLNGTEKSLPNKLRENDVDEEHHNNNTRFFKAYSNSGYDYDDAELLAKLWNISVLDAKYTIGAKIENKITHLLPDEIKEDEQGC